MRKTSDLQKVKPGLYAYVKNGIIVAFTSYVGKTGRYNDWILYCKGGRSIHCFGLWQVKRVLKSIF